MKIAAWALQASGLIFKDAVETIAIEDPDGSSLHQRPRPFQKCPLCPPVQHLRAWPVQASAAQEPAFHGDVDAYAYILDCIVAFLQQVPFRI